MPTPIIAGNWKMNTSVQEARDLVGQMKPALEAINGVEKVVCPPFISLVAVKEIIEGSSISLGAQNMYFEERGAYTGEISPTMLVGLCQLVILGHSERRQHFSDTDSLINRKVKAALKAGLRPILCVGERLEEREQGKAEEVVSRQLRADLDGVTAPEGLVVAYEPVWAIGTGRAATADIAQAIMATARHTLASLYGEGFASEIPLLYGGSVTPDNIGQFIKERDIDGALVGGASLKASDFVEIVRRTAKVKTAA